jgi:hypothetical protein
MLDLTVSAEEGKGEELYEYPGGYTDPEHGKRLARIRLEELRFPQETWSGRGRTLALGAGSTFEVTRHPQLDWNRKLLAVRVAHEGRREEAAGAVATHCEATFFAIAASRPYRPLRKTARPEISGFQRATVVGPEGEEIHTDRHGRVKLAFNWNTGTSEPAKSGWVRVTQSWAGPGFGTFFLPRIGQEVLVSYQGGDPDRPAVIGAAYNGAHPTAVELPKDKTQSTIRTRSSPYTGGFNELLLEDAAGSERIFVHAQKDEKIEVLADKDQRVDGQETLTVKKDRTQEVWGSQGLEVKQDDTGMVGGNRTLSVVGDRTTMVEGDHTEVVGLMQKVQVSGSRDATVTLASADTIGAAAALNVGGVYDINVGAAMNTFVGGAHTVEVGGARVEIVGAVRTETVAGDSSASVGGGFALDVDGRVTTSVGKDYREEIGGRTEIEVKEQVALSARSFTLEADTFSLVVGGKVVLSLDKSGVLQVNVSSITIDGSAISLRGARVQKVAPAAVQQEQLRIKQLEELRSALTFVGVSLVDQEGRPVPGEPFLVEFPGGALKRGVTGGDGTVKVPGSKEGTAKVTFTRLDPAAWGKAGEKKRQPSSSAVATKRHVVRQGECLASIARRHGASETMRVYQDPANAGLRKLRPNPHVLNPGDVVAVPQAKPKTVDCQTRQTHQFVVTLPKRKLRMELRDPFGEPLPNAPYRVVAGSLELEGKTDGGGVMEKEIPADATEVELHAHGVVRHLFVAGLNPLKETEDGGLAGVQARLRNLGYDPGSPGSTSVQLGPETKAAIEAFQRDRGLAPTGEIDEALLSALRSGHEV